MVLTGVQLPVVYVRNLFDILIKKAINTFPNKRMEIWIESAVLKSTGAVGEPEHQLVYSTSNTEIILHLRLDS